MQCVLKAVARKPAQPIDGTGAGRGLGANACPDSFE